VVKVVGLTARRLAEGRVQGWKQPGYGELSAYADSVVRAGGQPVLLPPHEISDADARDLVARLDAVVLTGGPDVDPRRYADRRHDHVYGVDPLVDAFEIALVHAIVEVGTPALAICRGLQVLNVALGGTLHQHLPDLPDAREHGVPGAKGSATLHTVDIDGGSRLHAVVGVESVVASCHHHQAIDVLAPGLDVVARASDGTIEAVVAAAAPNLLAVQWHPEDTARTDPSNQRLFDAIVGRHPRPTLLPRTNAPRRH
jgi:putative glutamine amidotransferase